MEVFNKLGIEIEQLIAPFLGVLFGYAILIYFKKLVENIVVWWDLRSKRYREGELIIINGEKGVISKLGFRSTTVLLVSKPEDTGLRWLSLTNTRMDFQKVERTSNGKLALIDVANPGATTTTER